MRSEYNPTLTCMTLITLQFCQCFLGKQPYGVLIVYFTVKQLHMPEGRVAFIKEDISVVQGRKQRVVK